MAAEVRDEIERAWKDVLQIDVGNILNSPVVAGINTEDRPIEFISVICKDAEHAAGGVYRVDVELTVVVERDKVNAESDLRERFGSLCRYIESPACPLRGYQDVGLKVFGYRVMGQEKERGTRQLAQRLLLKVGAAALAL